MDWKIFFKQAYLENSARSLHGPPHGVVATICNDILPWITIPKKVQSVSLSEIFPTSVKRAMKRRMTCARFPLACRVQTAGYIFHLPRSLAKGRKQCILSPRSHGLPTRVETVHSRIYMPQNCALSMHALEVFSYTRSWSWT